MRVKKLFTLVNAAFFLTTAPSALGQTSVKESIADLYAKIQLMQEEKIGMIESFVGSEIPDDYLPCDGSTLSVTEYPVLFKKIGYTFGGSGESFQLPDLRGQFLRGWNGSNAGSDAGRVLGSTQTFSTSAKDLSATTTRTARSSVQVHDGTRYYGLNSGGHRWTTSSGTVGIPSIWQGALANDGGAYPWGGAAPGLAHGAGRHLYFYSIGGSWGTTVSGGTETRPTNVAVQFIIKAKSK